jgi:hypothetical protein
MRQILAIILAAAFAGIFAESALGQSGNQRSKGRVAGGPSRQECQALAVSRGINMANPDQARAYRRFIRSCRRGKYR